MSQFDLAVAYILKNEGGLEENERDPAGITNHGISLRFLKALTPEKRKTYRLNNDEPQSDDIRNLTESQATAIYFGEFWTHAPFDKINNQNACNYLFDAAANMGIAPAIKCAQRACWSVMKEKDKPIEDGILGLETIAAINQCAVYFMPAVRSERAGEYRLIAEKNPTEKEFLDGWLSRSYK